MDELPSDERLVAFLDGEAAESEIALIESRLERDPSVRARLQLLSEATSLVREAFEDVLREPVPERLLRAAAQPGARILTFRPRLPGFGRRVIAVPRRWANLAAAACVCLLAAGGSALYLTSGETPASGVLSIIAGNHNMLIASADAGENTVFDVPPGAEQKLPVDIRIPDLKPWSLSFQGARKIVVDQGKPAYQFFYKTDNKELGAITVTVWKSNKPDMQPTFTQRDGVNLMYWRHAGRGYAIVGGTNKGYMWGLTQDVAWQLHAD